MRHLISLFLLVMSSAMLVACTSHQTDYINKSKTISAIMLPPGVSIKPEENYYPVPATTETTSPSIVPPGSDLQRFSPKKQVSQPQAQTQLQKQASTLTSWSQTKGGGESLVLSEQQALAWKQVGGALQKTPYKILDQDVSMGSYYILDEKSTNDKITATTPIYRLVLQASGSNTDIVLLNQNNEPATPEVSKRILGALKEQL